MADIIETAFPALLILVQGLWILVCVAMICIGIWCSHKDKKASNDHDNNDDNDAIPGLEL